MPSKKRRRVNSGVTVTAVKSTGGPPATTVRVEVDPTKLKEEVGDFAGVKQVVAEIPERSQDSVSWRPEHMHMERRVARDSGEPLETYSVTHYGPSDAHERGVAVTVETGAGPLAAQRRGEAHSVSEAGKPGESRKISSPTRRE